MRSSFQCRPSYPLARYINDLFNYWVPPPAVLVDLTAGLNSTTRFLFHRFLTGDTYKIIRLDLDLEAALDIQANLLQSPFKPNIADLLYIDPPYSQTMGRRGLLKADTNLHKTQNIEQFPKGFKHYPNIMHHLPIIAKTLLKPHGTLIIKLQDSQTIPHITPQVFQAYNYLTSQDLIFHDYAIYTYFPKRPSLKPWKVARRLHMAHGYLLNFQIP